MSFSICWCSYLHLSRSVRPCIWDDISLWRQSNHLYNMLFYRTCPLVSRQEPSQRNKAVQHCFPTRAMSPRYRSRSLPEGYSFRFVRSLGRILLSHDNGVVVLDSVEVLDHDAVHLSFFSMVPWSCCGIPLLHQSSFQQCTCWKRSPATPWGCPAASCVGGSPWSGAQQRRWRFRLGAGLGSRNGARRGLGACRPRAEEPRTQPFGCAGHGTLEAQSFWVGSMPGASKFEAVASIKSFLTYFDILSCFGDFVFLGHVREEIRASIVFFASVRQMPRGYNLLFSLSVPLCLKCSCCPNHT